MLILSGKRVYMKRTLVYRMVFYLAGLLVLALGLTLNTKAGLGVSPIISVSFSVSTIWDFNFGNTTLVLYAVFVVAEMVLHLLQYRRFRAQAAEQEIGHAKKIDLRLTLLLDALQFPLSLIFTRFLNVFSAWIPTLETDCAGTFAGTFPGRLLFLCLAIVLTGVGAAASLDMRLVPNPGDGIVQAIADTIGKSVGFTKNCFDVCNISVTLLISFLFAGRLTGVGIGTVVAVIGVGRVIALFNHIALRPMAQRAGLEPST